MGAVFRNQVVLHTTHQRWSRGQNQGYVRCACHITSEHSSPLLVGAVGSGDNLLDGIAVGPAGAEFPAWKLLHMLVDAQVTQE